MGDHLESPRKRSERARPQASQQPAGPETTTGEDGAAGGWKRLERGDSEASFHHLADLGRLVSEVAHEIRNPLVAIETYFQLRDSHPKDELDEFAAQASQELQRVERLIDLLLDHSRSGRMDSEAGCPGAALGAVEVLLGYRASSRGVGLGVANAANLPRVTLGDDALRQVLLNLLLNAIDASPPGSHIRVTHEIAADTLWLRIDDEGPGVPETPSAQSGRSGSGLGLPVSRRLVEGAGGTLEIGRSPAGGARISLCLPRATSAQAPE